MVGKDRCLRYMTQIHKEIQKNGIDVTVSELLLSQNIKELIERYGQYSPYEYIRDMNRKNYMQKGYIAIREKKTEGRCTTVKTYLVMGGENDEE